MKRCRCGANPAAIKFACRNRLRSSSRSEGSPCVRTLEEDAPPAAPGGGRLSGRPLDADAPPWPPSAELTRSRFRPAAEATSRLMSNRAADSSIQRTKFGSRPGHSSALRLPAMAASTRAAQALPRGGLTAIAASPPCGPQRGWSEHGGRLHCILYKHNMMHTTLATAVGSWLSRHDHCT